MFKKLALLAMCALLSGGLVWADGGISGSGTDPVLSGAIVQQPAGLHATQTIAAGGIIAADSCGGLKPVTAAGAVSTDATNAITAPAVGNTGCYLLVCNVGSTNTITIKHSTNTQTSTGADLALAAKGCAGFVSTGTVWLPASAMVTGS